MKKLLLFCLFCAITSIGFAQTFPVHDVDDCKLMYDVSKTNATYTASVANPVGADASTNVSSLLATANNGNAQFVLPYSIEAGAASSIDWSARFYSANAGSNNVGSGRFIVRLINRTVGGGANDRVDLGTFNKDGGSWQTESGSSVTLNPTNAAAINAAGGFNTILIIASSNAAAIETLYFDNFQISVDYNLSDVTADLDSGNAWIYNNRDGDNKILPNFQSTGLTLDENIATPTTTGNDASTVTRITRGTGPASLIQFNHTAIDPSVTAGSIKMRVYVACQSPYVPKIRINFRDDGDVASQYASSVDNPLVPGIWNELDFDISAMTTGTAGGAVYNQMLILFDPGEASAADGLVYYIDALQIPPFSSTFDGDTDATWNTAANWSEDVLPNGMYNVTIPASQNVNITSSTAATTNNLTVDGAGSLTIAAGGSLIVKGTSTGNVTYNRTLNFVSGNANGWHLLSSPVAGQTFNESFASTNNLALSSGKRGFAYYNDALASGSKYVYLLSDDTNASEFNSGTYSGSGVGYSAKIAASGTVAFTGTINTADVNGVTVTSSGDGFNLLGNPYTAYVSSQTLLNANPNSTGVIYTWTEGGGYRTRTAASNFIIPPGQGFFVKMNSGSTFDFAESNQTSGTQAFQKSAGSVTKVKLMVNDGSLNRNAEIQYFDTNATKGYDWGYDGEIFTGQSDALEVYSHLLENNDGKNYQIQALPKSDMETMIVPVGIKASAGKELTFTAESVNLPNGLRVFIEDRETNTFTELTTTSNYKVSISVALNGIGRFFLHTTASALSTESVILEDDINIYTTSKNNLRITGVNSDASVKLFNILGKQMLQTSFNSKGIADVTLPNLTTGIYVVQLVTNQGKLNKKIVIE